MAADLTPKQQAFIAEYTLDLNATQAAIRAGYSERTAGEQASRLLTNVRIAAAVQAALDARAERTQISADRVIAELAAIAFSDLRDVATWGEDTLALIDSSDLSESAARAVREVVHTASQTDSGTTKRIGIKQHDKLKALELLGKHLGMFSDKVDVKVSGGITLTALSRLLAERKQGELEQ